MKIIGEFYFVLTKNGNLLGEFTNNGMEKRWDVECANYYSDGKKGNFDCTFIATWLEDKKLFKSFIKIVKIDEFNYTLKWSNQNGKENFFGNAKLENKVLIGNYTNHI